MYNYQIKFQNKMNSIMYRESYHDFAIAPIKEEITEGHSV